MNSFVFLLHVLLCFKVPTSASASTSASLPSPWTLAIPSPWTLAIEARRRTARLQVRNEESQLKPLMETLAILDSHSSAEEWSYPLLHHAASSGLDLEGRGAIWGHGREDDLGAVDADRGSERERNGVYAGNVNDTGVNISNGNGNLSNGRPVGRTDRSSITGAASSRRRPVRTVPDLMRESWSLNRTSRTAQSSMVSNNSTLR